MAADSTSREPFEALHLPADAEYVRTTPAFTDESVPAGLLKSHQVAENTWAVLTVRSGALDFAFEDHPGSRRLDAGATQVIPPRRLHQLIIGQAVFFDLAFYRTRASATDVD